jgi:hypothetical protein
VFYRENKDKIKDSPREEGMSTMKAVGAAWHALSESERMEYNTRAAAEADSEVDGEAEASS